MLLCIPRVCCVGFSCSGYVRQHALLSWYQHVQPRWRQGVWKHVMMYLVLLTLVMLNIFLETSIYLHFLSFLISDIGHSWKSFLIEDKDLFILHGQYILLPGLDKLTHWGRDKMATILWTTFSKAFSSKKMFEIQLKFHRILFLRVQLTVSQLWFR